MHGTSPTAATLPRADADAVELSPRAMLGRYLVLGVLGRGGMGVVYSGFDEQLRRRVAIKRINRRGVDERSRQRSLREAQAMACLAHPNIVTVFEVFEVDAQLCIVMEYIAGRTLRGWLADVRPSPGEILAALIQAGSGVAVAHAAGLVHRDLKPDNIMIDEDGRVRVMDFGLARVVDGHLQSHEFEVTGTAPGDSPAGTAAYTGAFLGTPGYVAPEQELGITADARSDVFSFCVLAFEALHGQRPFAGTSDSELLVAMVAGRIVEEADSGVPDWLDAVIRRGLDAMPAARWPTMDALLAALASDPLARRRRRLRAAALFALAAVLVVVAMHVASLVRGAAERARIEEAAATRLHATLTTIARAEAVGDTATAEAAFRTFVADPEHRDTRSLTRAWLTRGDRLGADPTAARAAYAEAYVHAHTLEDERESLHRLSGVFVDQWDGVGLGRSVDLLRARGADDPDLAELGFQAALWQRDLPAAAAELAHVGHPSAVWRSTLDHLSRSTATGLDITKLVVLPGPGPLRIAVRDVDSTRVTVLDAALTEVHVWRDASLIELVPRTSWALAQTADEARIVDVLTGAVLGRGAPRIAPFAPFDATGDGVPELVFGRVWPHYGLLRWDGLGQPGAHVREAHPGTDTSNSTFDSHVVGDLDGDGADELVIAFGPWSRFDLRVFRPDVRGELELVATRQLGRIGDLQLVRHGPRRLLAAFVDNWHPAPDVFPEPPHVGGPPGVHFFEWADGELHEVDYLALPRCDTFGRFMGRAGVVGDLDGDGRDDLVSAIERDGRGRWLMMLRQTDDGFSPPLLLSGSWLFGGAQLDDDAALELFIGREPENELLVLGRGDEPTPHLAQPAPEPPPLPAALQADPWLASRWTRAGDLTALALQGPAAASLRDAALMVVDRPAKSALLDRAGELFASEDLMFEVLALEPDIHDDPRVRDRAAIRRAQALSRVGRHEDALAEAEALLRASVGDAEPRRLASALVDDLSALLAPDTRIDLDFAAPLAPNWRVHTPGALRRGPRATLRLAIPATNSPVAELPVEWAGGPVSLEVALDLERLEYGASVEISLVDASDERWLGAAFSGQGGGGRLQQTVWVKASGTLWNPHTEQPVESATRGRKIHLLMTYYPAHGDIDLMIVNDGEVQLGRLAAGSPPGPGPHRLRIGSFVDSNQTSLAVADLRRLTLRGVRLVSPSPADLARDRPAQLLAEADPRAALAALSAASHPRGEAVHLLALAELGDLEGLATAAANVLAHAEDPRWLGDLALALRRHPLAAAALRAAAGPALLPVLGSVWAFARPHRNDAAIRVEVLEALRDVEQLAPRIDAERDALRGLLETRAELWLRNGQLERASRDSEAAARLGPAPGGPPTASPVDRGGDPPRR